jgi:hypothetical protein
MVLGEDIQLTKISHMEEEALVGKFTSRWMTAEDLKLWTQDLFMPILGYEWKSLTLAKGWIAWITHLVEDANKIAIPLFPPPCKYNYKWPRDYGKLNMCECMI